MERYTGFDSRKSSPPPAKHTYGEVSTHQWGDGTLHASVRIAGKLTPCHTQIWRRSANQWGDGTIRMGLIRGKAYRLPQTHMVMVSTPAGRWKIVQGMFKIQTLTLYCAHKAAYSQFSGAMERYTRVLFARKLNACENAHIPLGQCIQCGLAGANEVHQAVMGPRVGSMLRRKRT